MIFSHSRNRSINGWNDRAGIFSVLFIHYTRTHTHSTEITIVYPVNLNEYVWFMVSESRNLMLTERKTIWEFLSPNNWARNVSLHSCVCVILSDRTKRPDNGERMKRKKSFFFYCKSDTQMKLHFRRWTSPQCTSQYRTYRSISQIMCGEAKCTVLCYACAT